MPLPVDGDRSATESTADNCLMFPRCPSNADQQDLHSRQFNLLPQFGQMSAQLAILFHALRRYLTAEFLKKSGHTVG
jgi:hypothetical protein